MAVIKEWRAVQKIINNIYMIRESETKTKNFVKLR